MTITRLAGIAALLFAGTCSAQTMYRCGNTFSQNPCGPDAKEIAISGVPQPSAASRIVQTPVDPDKAERMKAECLVWIKERIAWKDRDSLKIGTTEAGLLRYSPLLGVEQVIREYTTPVNAKNSFGAYIGEKLVVCQANADDTRIVNAYVPSI